MKKRSITALLALALSHSVPARAEISSPAASTAEESGQRAAGFSGKIGYLTSWAGGRDYRSFRTSGGDDGEAAFPTLSYLNARLDARPFRSHHLSLGFLQSLDSASTRSVAGARGKKSPLPGRIASLRHEYGLSRSFALTSGLSYTNDAFSDPKLGAAYRFKAEQGWGQKTSLGLSVPTSGRSRKSNLVTRASLRSSLTYAFADRFEASAGLSHSRPFYSRAEEIAPARKESNPSLDGKRGRRSGGRGAAPVGDALSEPSIATLQEVDLVMMEREVDRTTGSLGLTFEPSNRWKLETGVGVTYLQTARQKAMWLSNAHLLGATYRFGSSLEAGTDLKLFSDVQKFRHPSIPKLWSFGLQLTYLLGTPREGS